MDFDYRPETLNSVYLEFRTMAKEQKPSDSEWYTTLSEPFFILEKNSVAWVRERTATTERPKLAGEASANFCG
jgi:hypothetical protein